MLKKLPTWVRWLLLLPSGVLAYLITYVVVRVFGSGRGLIDLGTIVLSNFLSVFVLLTVAAAVAPQAKKTVVVAIACLYLLAHIFLLYRKFTNNLHSVSWFELVVAILAGISALPSVLHFLENEVAEQVHEP